MEKLEAIIEEQDLWEKVRFLGRVEADELHSLYRDCRVFVFPSLIETFGNPLLEAMAEGAAITCSDCAAMPEILDDAGLKFDPLKPDDIAAKINTLLEDEGTRKSLAKRAIERAKTFTWERTADKTRNVFRSVVGRSDIPGEEAR